MDELTEATFLAASEQHMQHLGIALHDAVSEQELPRSQEMCPKDTETLAESARVSDPVTTVEGTTVILSYGRDDDRNPKTGEPSSSYAVDVHERMDIVHPIGHAKFLELAHMEGAATLAARIAAKIH